MKVTMLDIYEMCKKDYPDILAELEKEFVQKFIGCRLWTCSNDFFIIRKITQTDIIQDWI